MFKLTIHYIMVIALLFLVSLESLGQTIPSASEDLEKKLISVLQSESPYQEKAAACRQLSVVGTKKSIGALATLLGDEKLSHMARYALEPIQDRTVDKAFREALGKLKGRPLVGVIGSVGVRHDTKAVGTLAKMLNDRDAEVTQAAARALGNIGNSQAAQALQRALANSSAKNQFDVCEGLFRCAEGFVAQGRNDEAIVIYDKILSLRAPHQVRGGALRGAILARQQDGLGLLETYLKNEDYILFSAAVQTAQELAVSKVTEVLLAVLDQLPGDRQILVIQTLAKRGDRKALPALYTRIKTADKPVRLAAIRALPQIKETSGLVLVKLFDDSDKEISRAALDNFAAIGGPQGDTAVMKMLQSSDTNKRLLAIELIGRRWMTSSIPALLKVAGGNNPKVRTAAVKKVGEMGSSTEVPALLDLLMKFEASPDLEVTERALSAICTKSDKPQTYTELFTRRLAQAQPAQKGALLRVLGAIGGANALQAVRSAVSDSQPDVHTAAIRVLSKWKTTDAAPVLLDLAKKATQTNDKTLCLRGYLGLASNQDLPAGERLAMCRQASDLIRRNDEKKLMLGALGKIISPEALPMITPYLDDPITRTEAGTAIITIAEKLLKSRAASRHAAKLIEPLEKVMQTNPDGGLARRAKTFLNQAKQKAKKP